MDIAVFDICRFAELHKSAKKAFCSALKIKTYRSLETSVLIYQ